MDAPAKPRRGPAWLPWLVLPFLALALTAAVLFLAAWRNSVFDLGPYRLSARTGVSDWSPGYEHWRYPSGEAWNVRLGDWHWTVLRLGS